MNHSGQTISPLAAIDTYFIHGSIPLPHLFAARCVVRPSLSLFAVARSVLSQPHTQPVDVPCSLSQTYYLPVPRLTPLQDLRDGGAGCMACYLPR